MLIREKDKLQQENHPKDCFVSFKCKFNYWQYEKNQTS